MDEVGGSMRLGNAEREAALGALEAHRIAGRLDAVEYEDRTVKAAAARVWAELDPLFADLPEPRPHPPAVSSRTAPAAPVPGAGTDRWVSPMIAALPFIALALFFLVRSWLVFLLIPAVAMILQAGRHREP